MAPSLALDVSLDIADRAGAGRTLIVADYYFAASGNDVTGNGTSANPYQTLDKASALISALPAGNATVKIFAFKDGDTFSSANGVQMNRPNLTLTTWYGGPAFFVATATTTNLVGGYVDDGVNFGIGWGTLTVRNLVLTGVGIATSTAAGIDIYSDNATPANYGTVIIDRCTVSGFGDFGIKVGSASGSKGFASITFTYNEVSGCNDGIGTYAASGYAHAVVTARYNLTHNNPGGTINVNNGSGISIGNAASGVMEFNTSWANGGPTSVGGVGLWTYQSQNFTIQFNESYNNTSGGADGDGFDIDLGCSGCIMQYNYSHGNKGAGFLVYANLTANNVNPICRYNISVNDAQKAAYGGLMLGQGNTATVTGARIYNNTVYHKNALGAAAAIAKNGSINFTNCVFADNIFYTNGSAAMVNENVAAITGVTFLGNDYAGNVKTVNWNGSVYGTIAAWLAANATQEFSGGDIHLEIDPGWTLPATDPVFARGENYHPELLTMFKIAPGSTGLNAAFAIDVSLGWTLPAVDYFRNTIVPANGLSVGAHYAHT